MVRKKKHPSDRAERLRINELKKKRRQPKKELAGDNKDDDVVEGNVAGLDI